MTPRSSAPASRSDSAVPECQRRVCLIQSHHIVQGSGPSAHGTQHSHADSRADIRLTGSNDALLVQTAHGSADGDIIDLLKTAPAADRQGVIVHLRCKVGKGEAYSGRLFHMQGRDGRAHAASLTTDMSDLLLHLRRFVGLGTAHDLLHRMTAVDLRTQPVVKNPAHPHRDSQIRRRDPRPDRS